MRLPLSVLFRVGSLRVVTVLCLLMLCGCSMQDFGSAGGGITDVLDSGDAYVENNDAELAAARAQNLANALVSWKQDHGLLDQDYYVGADDVLEVTVYSLEVPGQASVFQLEISKEGLIELPLAGTLQVLGMNTREIERAVAQKYQGIYLRDPRVMVKVAIFQSAPVVVSGAVSTPGIYYLQHNRSSVLEVLTMAGGLAEGAGDELVIIRPSEPEPSPGTPAPAAPATEAAPLPTPEEPVEALDYDFSQPPPGTASNGMTVAADALAASDTNAVVEAAAEVKPEKKKKKKRFGLFGRKEKQANEAAPEETPVTDSADATDADGATHVTANASNAVAEAETDFVPRTETITIDLTRLLDRGDMRLNVPVFGSDMITIPPAKQEFVYVLGYVNTPGAYSIGRGHDRIRALHAVSKAQGLSGSARAANCVLIRDRKPTAVDLTKIVRGKRPPLWMQSGDTLIVGSSFFGKIVEFVKPSAGVAASYSPTTP